MEDCGILDVYSNVDMFSLLFVFLPRLNVQLTQFADAWNMHPLRTENCLSPMQLWDRGLLSAAAHWQEEISAGLTVQADYGVEVDTLSNSYIFNETQVTVPEVSIILSDQQLQYINDNFNPLQRSEYNGIDIYGMVRDYLLN